MSALYLAAKKGNSDILKLLLNHDKIDANILNIFKFIYEI